MKSKITNFAIYLAELLGSILLTPIVVNQLNRINPNWNSNFSWIYKIITFKINLVGIIISIMVILFIVRIFTYVIYLRKPFRIIKATYGTDNAYKNFTQRLNDSIVDNKIEVKLNNSFIGSDPAEGIKKYAKIKYKFNNKVLEVRVDEYDLIQLPEVLPINQ